MRWPLLLALPSLAAASSACGVSTCTSAGYFYEVVMLEGPGSIADHVSSASLDDADLTHGSYEGTLTNRDGKEPPKGTVTWERAW